MIQTSRKSYLGISAYQFAFVRILTGIAFGLAFLTSSIVAVFSKEISAFLLIGLSLLSFLSAFGFQRRILSGISLVIVCSLLILSSEMTLTLNMAVYIWIQCLWLLIPLGEPFSRQPKNFEWSMPVHLVLFSWVLFIYFLGISLLDIMGKLPATGISYQSVLGLMTLFLFLFDRRWLKPASQGIHRSTVYFDGVCNLCNAFVDFLVQEDQSKKIRFAPLQGSTAKSNLPTINTEDLETVILESDGAIRKKSKAVFFVLNQIGGFWRLFVILQLIPVSICDLVYDWVAKNRYSFFGRQETCRLPSPYERTLFLD